MKNAYFHSEGSVFQNYAIEFKESFIPALPVGAGKQHPKH